MFKKIVSNKNFKILIVSVFVILVAVQAGKSYVLDEIDFPAVAHATSQTLKPIYYRGQALPHDVGTYHPTLYINSLALFVKIFGFNEISVRFYGVVCTLFSAYLLLRILRLLIKKNETAETLFLGLFLLNPYTIASTTLPDIDSTILPVVLLLFIYVSLEYLHIKKDMSSKAVWLLGALFGLTLWSKLTTPLIIPFFLACLAIVTTKKKYKKSLLFTLRVTLIGAVGFAITYYLYCRLLGLSTTYTYHFLIDSFTKGTKSQGFLAGAIDNLKYVKSFVYWPTIPIVGLLGVAFIGVMFDRTKDEKTIIKKLLVVTSLLVTMFYLALISPFGGFFKYPFPVFGLGILTIVLFYDRYLKDTKIVFWWAFIATVLGFFVEKHFWRDSMFLNGKPFAGMTILLVIIVAFSFIILKTNLRRLAALFFMLVVFFSIGFQLSISRIQAISTYSTKYDYGKQGQDQATAYLRSNTSPNEVIWSMKDVGFYVNDKYIESYSYYFDSSLQGNLISLLKAGKVRYYVVSTGIGEDDIIDYPKIKQILNAYAVPVKQFGNFIIYKAKA